jgi:hypothetical protein
MASGPRRFTTVPAIPIRYVGSGPEAREAVAHFDRDGAG